MVCVYVRARARVCMMGSTAWTFKATSLMPDIVPFLSSAARMSGSLNGDTVDDDEDDDDVFGPLASGSFSMLGGNQYSTSCWGCGDPAWGGSSAGPMAHDSLSPDPRACSFESVRGAPHTRARGPSGPGGEERRLQSGGGNFQPLGSSSGAGVAHSLPSNIVRKPTHPGAPLRPQLTSPQLQVHVDSPTALPGARRRSATIPPEQASLCSAPDLATVLANKNLRTKTSMLLASLADTLDWQTSTTSARSYTSQPSPFGSAAGGKQAWPAAPSEPAGSAAAAAAAAVATGPEPAPAAALGDVAPPATAAPRPSREASIPARSSLTLALAPLALPSAPMMVAEQCQEAARVAGGREEGAAGDQIECGHASGGGGCEVGGVLCEHEGASAGSTNPVRAGGT